MTTRINVTTRTLMKRLQNKLTAALTVLLLTAAATLQAGPTLHDLDMTVRLAADGDAYITEVRRMSIDDVGTECYIVMGFMNGSTVRDLTVSDETGLTYENIGDWDVDRSRSWKAGKCGIVTKSDGYELCWGLGNEGSRTYTVSYRVTDLVRAYDDADGFNFMFVAQNIKPAAEHARITFMRQDEQPIAQEDVKMWAFRYNGDIQWRDGTVVAETASAMDDDQSMIVMLRFEKGVLQPSESVAGSFEQLRERAFEGSDYNKKSLDDWIDWLCEILALLAIFVLLPIGCVIYFAYIWWKRHEAKQNLLWFRGLPYNGSLKKSYEVLNAYSWVSYSKENLISALVVKLISIGALAIEEHWVEPSGLRKLTGGQPKLKKLIAIKELHISEKTPDRFLLKRLFAMFDEAAGDDHLLQPNELRTWMKKHTGSVETLLTNMKASRSLHSCSKDLKNVREVLGMKLFLEDFTLANERHATEVALWKDYLVFAELFGIAKQVRKDMMQANPEYLKMDDICRQLNDNDVLPLITAAAMRGVHDVESANSTWKSGGGGWASSGGGGGFSGGGSGGGVR